MQTYKDFLDYEELSLKNVYIFLKNSPYILKFIPDYSKDQLSEREYINRVVCSIYLYLIYNIINAAQKKCTVTAEYNRCFKIELTHEITKEIDEII